MRVPIDPAMFSAFQGWVVMHEHAVGEHRPPTIPPVHRVTAESMFRVCLAWIKLSRQTLQASYKSA